MNNIMSQNLIIKGASQNNLKNIDVIIPRNKLVVITGVSGSGKQSNHGYCSILDRKSAYQPDRSDQTHPETL
jgi:ABC-type lipoprotein export system ATPase subunit